MMRIGAIISVVSAGIFAALAPGLVSAQETSRQPDAQRGAVIAAQGTADVPSCAQCHAFNGMSDSSGAFPRLTGQSTSYLARQMRDFASSVRDSAIMSPIAKSLSANDIEDISAYYANSNAPFPPLANANAAIIKKGEEFARIGSASKSIPACNSCHGPGGTGLPPNIPYLAGQYAEYITLALQMWKGGYRKNSSQVMGELAKRLDDQDIAAIAAYYQQVRSIDSAAAK